MIHHPDCPFRRDSNQRCACPNGWPEGRGLGRHPDGRFVAPPTVHLNGTSGASLIEQNRVVRVTLRTAIVALQEARPHARDYYPQGELAFSHAQSEYKSRMERLESVLHELEELGHKLAER
jgi:hypothetical protein